MLIIPKGYRARERAALQRKDRGRVSEEVRAQRAAVLEPKIHSMVVKARDPHELETLQVAKEVSAPEQTPQPEQTKQPEPVVETEQVVEVEGGDGEPDDSQDEVSEGEPQAPAKPKSKSKKK
ncbi:hypothetical protein [Bradyrhizobium sp. SZCCHNRI2010]|uniref:hypothetical protein n=1 Tax=Bradyrhizobium sp. SZCCHNRI2010 TaxID=3057283 RepID=UPI0028EDF087|nr:hypothetical protein [Bradyrhizobium sp. SZCCHNRI2010]